DSDRAHEGKVSDRTTRIGLALRLDDCARDAGQGHLLPHLRYEFGYAGKGSAGVLYFGPLLTEISRGFSGLQQIAKRSREIVMGVDGADDQGRVGNLPHTIRHTIWSFVAKVHRAVHNRDHGVTARIEYLAALAAAFPMLCPRSRCRLSEHVVG